MRDCAPAAPAKLAYHNRKTGWAPVEALMLAPPCRLLTVNLSQVLARLAAWDIPPGQTLAMPPAMAIDLVAHDPELALGNARIRPATRPLGLRLSHRACPAQARQPAAVAITADPPWTQLDPGLGITSDSIRP